MGAIGDYVHLSWKGYLVHGPTRDGKASDYQYDSGKQYQEIKRRVYSRLSAQNTSQLSEVENLINQIRTSDETMFQDIRQEIEEELRQSFGDYIKSIDFSKGIVEISVPNISRAVGRIKAEETKDKNLEKLIKKINLLEDILAEKIAAKDGLSEGEFQELVNTKNNIEDLYNQCFIAVDTTLGQRGYKSRPWSKKNGKRDELRKAANAAIAKYAQYPPLSLIEGTLWEYILAAAQQNATRKAEMTVKAITEETIKKNLKGQNYAQVQFNLDNFSKNYNIQQTVGERMRLSISDDGQDVLLSRRSKTDVSLSWNSSLFNISAKNVKISNNSYKWTAAVSDSPMLAMISGLDSTFVNHYLNVATTHPDNSNMKKEGVNIKQDMKYSLFYQALTGDNLVGQSDIANIFAINDKATGKFKLVYMNQILNSLENSIGAISVKLGNSNIMDYLFTNNKNKTTEERIRQLIMELHATKISASFNVVETQILK